MSLAMIWLGVVFTTLILYVGVDGSSELALIAAVGLLTSRTAIYSIRNILKHNCVPFPIVVTLCSTLLRLRNT